MTASEKMLTLMFLSKELLARNGKEVPMWFFGNPGCAKSETVKLFAEIMGYEYLDLEANSRTEEDIKGFMTTPSTIDQGSLVSCATILPDWWDQIERNKKNGKKTLVFIDEINTLSPPVAAVLLQMVQKRATRSLELDPNVLIVAAGNYWQNLDLKQMSPMVTMLNRFCLINLKTNDEDVNLSNDRYENILLGTSKEILSYKEVYKKKFSTIFENFNKVDKISQEDKEDTELESRLFMACVNKFLNSKLKELSNSKKIDFNEKRIANLYTESPLINGDIYNLCTLRTKDFLVEMSGAFFRFGGLSAINTELFIDVVKGLAGFGAVYNSTDHDVNFIEIWIDLVQAIEDAKKYYNTLSATINNTFINKLKDSIITVAKKHSLAKPKYELTDYNNIKTTIDNLMSDKDFNDKLNNNKYQRIFDIDLFKSFINYVLNSLPSKTTKKTLLEKINFYNASSDAVRAIYNLIKLPGLAYQQGEISLIVNLANTLVSKQEDILINEKKISTITNLPEIKTLSDIK